MCGCRSGKSHKLANKKGPRCGGVPKLKQGAVVMMITRKGRYLQETELSGPIDPHFIIPGLEPGQVGILSAPGGTGKTILSLELAFSLASGVELFRAIPVESPHRVLFIELEETYAGLVNSFCIARSCFFDNSLTPFFPTETLSIWHDEEGMLPLVDSNNRIVKDNVEWLKEMSKDMSLVIIDHLSKCHIADENSSVPMTILMSLFRKIGQETRAGFLLLHHTRKGSVLNREGDTAESARGSSAIVNCARLVMTLSKTQNKPRHGVCGLLLTWAKINGHRPIDPIELVRMGDGKIVEEDPLPDVTIG